MIDHVSIGVRDLKVSTAFYKKVLAALDYELRDERPETSGFGRRGKSHSEFWLNARPGMAKVPADSGTHICLRTKTAEAVKAFYDAAIRLGASGDGAPGIRPHYSENYYAAFIRDFDGNKIEVVTFVAL
ncbi:MAG: VOC family protein [Xanthobacteraceae bacterium]|nr:VOC family protein [Xanthobacteraceae bacterium]MBX3534774.1 VOC family protein [Xanthobacteraceae bacterium]MBX3549979.1 VOC family protein [Xanthobacteraceae bacterium]MCW5674231.1 VOC family protein [Xanthobacteraceae bacterium]MCW5677959.1 VOC family protein [Xanthobacteraceae bacterium]